MKPLKKGSLAFAGGVVLAGSLLTWALLRLPASQGTKERKPAPELSMPDIDGMKRSLADYKGKVVLLDFWATWCEPCLEELPDLVRLHEAHKDEGFTMIGVAMDAEGTAIVAPFVRQNKIPYPILISKGDLPAGFPIPGFPTAFLIDREGKIARRYIGPKSYEELERDLADLK
jgi:thiol-disulfide isomerase/thioredoxin